jgi:hypothetical protein
MSISKKFAIFAAGLGMLFVPVFDTAKGAKTKAYCRHFYYRPIFYPVPRTIDGKLVDRDGWRLRSGGWDNNCFNIPWLTSQYACPTNNGN